MLTRLPGEVVIEAAGVGYRLAVSSETLSARAARGRAGHAAHAHLVLRDDGMHLYGFSTEAERELFLMLIGVQGVGPKVALAVLSGGAPRELLNAIASGDTARFQAVPGIGKRTAERIIVELREKVAGQGHRRDRRAPHRLGRPAHARARGPPRPRLHAAGGRQAARPGRAARRPRT